MTIDFKGDLLFEIHFSSSVDIQKGSSGCAQTKNGNLYISQLPMSGDNGGQHNWDIKI